MLHEKADDCGTRNRGRYQVAQIKLIEQTLAGLGCEKGKSHRNKSVRLQLHCAIYRPDSFVLMLRYCANLKVIRYESTTLNRIVADKSHRVIVA